MRSVKMDPASADGIRNQSDILQLTETENSVVFGDTKSPVKRNYFVVLLNVDWCIVYSKLHPPHLRDFLLLLIFLFLLSYILFYFILQIQIEDATDSSRQDTNMNRECASSPPQSYSSDHPIHSNLRPYKCFVCKVAFRFKVS